MASKFTMMTKVVYGLGCLKQLPKELEILGVKRPWIVTDPGIVAAGIVDQIKDVLEAAGYPVGVFSGVTPTAKVESVDESWRLASEFDADGIIALGGGSALVVGKATGVLGGAAKISSDVKSISEFAFKPPVDVLPVVAIPTTAGSGAEVSPVMPLVDTVHSRKYSVQSQATYPRVALLDATLLKNLPASVASHSGIDALTHAIESCLTDQTTMLTTGLALPAMQTLMQKLRTCCYTTDLQAKQDCIEASTVANWACFNTKLGYVHGLARNVQTLFGLPYGLTIGVFLIPVLEFNLQAVPERFAMMAPYLGVKTEGLTMMEQGAAAIYEVKQLLSDLGFPKKFTAEQVDRNAISRMAKMVFMRHAEKNYTLEELDAMEVKGYAPSPNIRKATYQDIVKLYEKSLDGWEL